MKGNQFEPVNVCFVYELKKPIKRKSWKIFQIRCDKNRLKISFGRDENMEYIIMPGHLYIHSSLKSSIRQGRLMMRVTKEKFSRLAHLIYCVYILSLPS